MKLTLNDLLLARPALHNMSTKEISATVAYKIGRIIRQINVELKDYETARLAVLKRVGATLPEGGTQYDIPPARRAEFNEELQALISTEVELSIAQIGIADLPDMTPADAMALWWLVEEPGPEAPGDVSDEIADLL